MRKNELTEKGAKWLAEALKHNKVRNGSFFHMPYNLFLKNLKELYLYKNHIGEKGASYFEEALKLNKVSLEPMIFLSYYLLINLGITCVGSRTQRHGRRSSEKVSIRIGTKRSKAVFIN